MTMPILAIQLIGRCIVEFGVIEGSCWYYLKIEPNDVGGVFQVYSDY